MRLRVVWLALFCVALTGTRLWAQARVITGTVTDSATGAGIGGVTITISGTRLGAYTKDNGSFLISGAPEGEVTLLFRYIGYKRRSLTVGADEGR